MADLNVVTSPDEEIVYLSKQIEGVYDLLAGVVHAINSLSERLTGDQFTLLIGQENSPRRFIPELRRVVKTKMLGDFELGPNPPAEHTEQVEPTVPS